MERNEFEMVIRMRRTNTPQQTYSPQIVKTVEELFGLSAEYGMALSGDLHLKGHLRKYYYGSFGEDELLTVAEDPTSEAALGIIALAERARKIDTLIKEIDEHTARAKQPDYLNEPLVD